MGLGKSIQTIAFITAVLDAGGKEESSNVKEFFTGYKESTSPTGEARKPVLIVMPASVVRFY